MVRVNKGGLYSKFKVVDAEVHLGKGLLMRVRGNEILDCNINSFSRQISKLNIQHAVCIPAPTYVLKTSKGKEISCLWEKKGKQIIYKKIFERNDKTISTIINPCEPYVDMNKNILQMVKHKNETLGKRVFYFAPILHPRLDSPVNIEDFLNDGLTVAVKVHGISTHCGPSDVPAWVITMLKKYDLPIFVHTDTVLSKHSSTKFEKDIQSVRMMNRARVWAKWAINKHIRMYLAHGAMLDEEAIKIINSSENLVTGIGPDAILDSDTNRIRKLDRKTGYLDRLLGTINHEKVLFSSDFPFNTLTPETSMRAEWGGKYRVINAAISSGLGNREINDILSKNATKFFRL